MVFYGLIVLIVASLLQGSVGLGMKKYKPFSWEVFWLVFMVLGGGIVPHIWMYIEVPQYMTYIAQAPNDILIGAALCGFVWGIAALLFGQAIDKIGISLTYGINMGVSASIGSLAVLFILGDLPERNALIMLIIGSVMMLFGVVVITKAGLLKDKEQQGDATVSANPGFVKGLIFVIIAGLGSAILNIGFVYADQVVQIAINDGVAPTSATLLAWIVVLAGGLVPQVGYTVYLIIKNKRYKDFTLPGCKLAYVKVVATSIVWFAALGVYAKATIMLGSLGPVIGWVAFNALALVISNFWGIKIGEWDGFVKPKKVLMIGNIILLVSFLFVGIANSMS